MIIKLVRHGQSAANAREVDATRTGDHNVHLTNTGQKQAQLAGALITKESPHFFNDALLYQSPYTRTRETMDHLLSGGWLWGSTMARVYEDPRLREVEWGYNKPEDHGDYVDEMRETHGKFYYRIEGGESPADCFDRISTFLETLMRQIQRKNADRILIVSHGLTIRCFVMRFMHLTVEQFDDIKNPKNCDIITISNETKVAGHLTQAESGQFSCGSWRIQGLRLPKDPQGRAYPWMCPMCKEYDVWPHPEYDNDATTSVCSQCEKCGEKLFSVKP